MFVDSVKSLDCDIYLSLTQFDESKRKKIYQTKADKKLLHKYLKKSFHPEKILKQVNVTSKALDQFIDKAGNLII